MTLFDEPCGKLAIAFPVAVGLSVDDDFEDESGDDDTFGYFEVGGVGEFDLGFIPESLGSWQFTVGARLVWLGDNTSEFNHGDDFEILGTPGLSIRF